MTAAAIRRSGPTDIPACEAILRSLPDWFGIEEAIVSYVQDLAVMETYVAERKGRVIGFLAVKDHNPLSAEIQVMAVAGDHHGAGVGSALVAHAEGILRSRGVKFLEVKTLGPSRPNEEYERTRRFYLHAGFTPLEENNLWGEGNPCLIMVKQLVSEVP
jgi:GNAT superfamily N-acetyltransferase